MNSPISNNWFDLFRQWTEKFADRPDLKTRGLLRSTAEAIVANSNSMPRIINGKTPVQRAAEYGDFEKLATLSKEGVDIYTHEINDLLFEAGKMLPSLAAAFIAENKGAGILSDTHLIDKTMTAYEEAYRTYYAAFDAHRPAPSRRIRAQTPPV